MSRSSLKSLQGAAGNNGGGKTIAVCGGGNYVTIVDIKDPANMTILGTLYNTAFSGIGYTGKGDDDRNLFFFNNWTNKTIAVCDISDPSNPALLQNYYDSSAFPSTSFSCTLDTTRELLFVTASASNRVICVDYSDPSDLSTVSTIASGTQLDWPGFMSIDTINEVVYVPSLHDDALTSIDYSTPTSLSILDEHYDSNFNQGRYTAIDVANNIVYGAGQYSDSFVAFDVSNPSSISTLDWLASSTYFNSCTTIALDLKKNVAFLFSNTYGVSSIDISNPSNLSRLDSITDALFTGGYYSAMEVDTEREIVFIKSGDSEDNLVALDYSDPSNLSILGSISNSTTLAGRSLFIK
jgi:hypothetical protein